MKIVAPLLSAACATILLTSGCDDPEKPALKIFSDQGLTLLQPARSYVEVGGLVVLPRHGHLEYLDPFDTISSESGTYVDFTAVIYGQTRDQSTRLSVALDSLRKIASLPIGITYSGAQDVGLSQIESSGRRLPTGQVRALIRKKETADAIQEQLAQGNRVFVVQEVYTGKGITLTSSTNTVIDATLGGKGSVPDCPSAASEPGKTPSGQQEDLASTSGTTVTTTSSSGVKDQNSQSKAPTSSGGAEEKSAAAKSPRPVNEKDMSSQGDSVGVCRSTASSITFKSETALPFAVRLNEIVSTPGGLLVKIGTFHFPPTTLGNADLEQATALIDQSHPVLGGLVHGHH